MIIFASKLKFGCLSMSLCVNMCTDLQIRGFLLLIIWSFIYYYYIKNNNDTNHIFACQI